MSTVPFEPFDKREALHIFLSTMIIGIVGAILLDIIYNFAIFVLGMKPI